MSRKVRLIPTALLLLIFLNSCTKEKIRTYKIATDSTAKTPPAPPIEPLPKAPVSPTDRVTWQAPADWKEETPGRFQTAVFSTPASGRVTVSMLPGNGGGIPANINRWREQVGLEALPQGDIGGQPLKIPGGEDEMLLFNLVPKDASAESNGILAAILPLDSESWYFKFTGAAGDMKKNGLAFMSFLRSVRVAGKRAAAAPASPAIAAPTSKIPKVDLVIPEGWVPSEGSAMRAASFSVTGADGATADVSVIPLPGDSGSVLDNVNRWRSQVQLAPIESPEDPSLGTKIDGPTASYFLSHMISTEPLLEGGKTAAISAAILKTPSHTWFFKITGDATLIKENREQFEAFVRSATFP